MPKRGKESRSSNHHSGSHFSPPPLSRQSRNDYSASSSRSTNNSNSGRRSPHSNDNMKRPNGNTHHGNSNRKSMNVIESPIILSDDDDGGYKNLDSNLFRENGNKLKHDPDESTRIVKHFVPSTDRYHVSQSVSEKPVFRGPETDVLHELEKDKLKSIRIQMIRADVQQNDSFRKAYVIEEPSSRSKGDKNHQSFDDRQGHFNSAPIHYDHVDKNYGSPSRRISHDRSMSPSINISRPPSPPLPYSPNRDHFNSDNISRRDRPQRSPERNDRLQRPEHFLEHHKLEDFSSDPPPEPRSPDMQRFRPDHTRLHRVKEEPIHFEERQRHSGSPAYFDNHYTSFRSPSPNIRLYSPKRNPMSPPSRELSPPLRDRPTHSNDRSRRRRSPPPRRDRSRDRRRRISPRRRTPPPSRSPIKRRDSNYNHKKRSTSRNRDVPPRKSKDKKKRANSKSQSTQQSQEEQQVSFPQQPQQQPLYPPPPGVVRMPPRPFPPGPMMIPLRPPPPFPPPMGAWRPSRPPMPAPPPAGWPYPRPRPFYYPY